MMLTLMIRSMTSYVHLECSTARIPSQVGLVSLWFRYFFYLIAGLPYQYRALINIVD